MIAVCGEALMDVIRRPDGTELRVPGGSPFNTARGLARLGVPAAFLGRLSTDAAGRELERLLRADGVRLDLATAGPEPTTVAHAGLDGSGAAGYSFVVEGTSAPNLTPGMLPDRLGAEVDVLHVGSLGLVLEPMATTLMELVRREGDGRVVVLDPNIRVGLGPSAEHRRRLHEVISRSTVVKASETDLAWLYPGLTYMEAVDRLCAEGVRLAVATLGARGAFAAHAGLHAAAGAAGVDVVDTIGAGDAFGAALLAWLHDHGALLASLALRPDGLRSALDFACLAAAITCGRPGADPPSAQEMRAAQGLP